MKKRQPAPITPTACCAHNSKKGERRVKGAGGEKDKQNKKLRWPQGALAKVIQFNTIWNNYKNHTIHEFSKIIKMKQAHQN